MIQPFTSPARNKVGLHTFQEMSDEVRDKSFIRWS